jgi:thiol-disulfide isomerase/thioredoxin
MTTKLRRINEFKSFVTGSPGAVVYFSNSDCGVCKVLKPKLHEMLTKNFPLIKFAYVDVSQAKELSAQQSVFTIPTILFYFDGKEFLRKSRNVNLFQLKEELNRIYNLAYGE